MILAGLVFVVVGLLVLLLSRIPGIGHLPGDIPIHRPGVSIYAPIATSIILSILLTIALNIGLRLFDK